MKRTILLFVLLSFFSISFVFAKSKPIKREFRAAWVTTVYNNDWPASPTNQSATNILDLIYLMDELKKVGMNAIIFQVRPECDALYNSTIEPWSYWLTGQQGKMPNPFYDPLQIAIEEAHKRGMELHAWFNPYRAVANSGSYPNSTNHVSITHPEWILTFNNLKLLDPGLPEVRDYLIQVIMDVVNRYDVDGIHFDDYFYPYPPNQITNQDDQTFVYYSRGFTNRGAWRRDNVNLLVKMVHDSIQAVKPHVKFGISPFGIWKNGVPYGIVGMDAYNVIYCDAIAWLIQQTVDYLTPQLYWEFGGQQDYGKLMPWWASQTMGRHLYPGHAVYKIYTKSWSNDEIPRQIQLNRDILDAPGSVFYNTSNVLSNPKGLTDSLKTNYYRYPAIIPIMDWKETEPPEPPLDFRHEIISSSNTYGFSWESPPVAVDGDTASRYILYRFDHSELLPDDIDNAENLAELTGINHSIPKNPQGNGPYYYAVSSLDRNSNESILSDLLMVSAPLPPPIFYPMNNDNIISAADTLKWFASLSATKYHIQVAFDSLFTDQTIIYQTELSDTFTVVSGLSGQQEYYWKVSASGAGGRSNYSQINRFVTVFPKIPVLSLPANLATNITINPTFVWNKAQGATQYQLQVSTSSLFILSNIILDTEVLDTMFTFNQLDEKKYYFWRVKAINTKGESNWTNYFRFQTEEVQVFVGETDSPRTYELTQNFPNPFRMDLGYSQTTIRYQLINEKALAVDISIYNIRGQKIRTIVDSSKPAGTYQISWDGRDKYGEMVSSGIYFYKILAGPFIKTNKMVVVR